MAFDPSDVGKAGSLFGYPYKEEEADLIILPVPWDVTVSYGEGTSWGPAAILEASPQLDFSLHGIEQPWTYKTFMSSVESEWAIWSEELRADAKTVIESLEDGQVADASAISRVNKGCQQMVNHVKALADAHLANNKVVGVLGGDHSTPLGLMQALADRGSFGILQIDAHMDLRKAYEGFDYSHASIMYNAMKIKGVSSLTQVGIRDFCEEEEAFINDCDKSVNVFYDSWLQESLFRGATWAQQVEKIISTLPEDVYVSLDIDGLDPGLCPGTGTPVPGGLTFPQLDFLLKEVASAGKRIIGFDLCEVSPGFGAWDANVGARVLYRLATYTALSQEKLRWKE